MKYIRTKEHIYKRLFIDRAIINECGYGACDKELNPIGETIIKQADTIKELCDEFVLVNSEHIWNNLIFTILDDLYEEYNKTQYIKWEIYGAIWTDKGLIYVAKMNEKGELELI